MTAAPSASQPVLVVMSILAGLNVVNGGLGALGIVSAQVAGCIALGTAAVAAGIMFYLRGVVVPADAVAVRVDGNGVLRSGPADQTIPTGAEVEPAVRATPSPY